MAPAFRSGARMRFGGAIAQLGERYNGIVEVSGSIPLSSTILAPALKNPPEGGFFAFWRLFGQVPGHRSQGRQG